jgi:hypothetical protein
LDAWAHGEIAAHGGVSGRAGIRLYIGASMTIDGGYVASDAVIDRRNPNYQVRQGS